MCVLCLCLSGQGHESLKGALSDLQDKYRDIRKLEQSNPNTDLQTCSVPIHLLCVRVCLSFIHSGVAELHQMFVELATLVEAQGELLDQIEYSVNSAAEYASRRRPSTCIACPPGRTLGRVPVRLSVCREGGAGAGAGQEIPREGQKGNPHTGERQLALTVTLACVSVTLI